MILSFILFNFSFWFFIISNEKFSRSAFRTFIRLLSGYKCWLLVQLYLCPHYHQVNDNFWLFLFFKLKLVIIFRYRKCEFGNYSGLSLLFFITISIPAQRNPWSNIHKWTCQNLTTKVLSCDDMTRLSDWEILIVNLPVWQQILRMHIFLVSDPRINIYMFGISSHALILTWPLVFVLEEIEI